MAKFGERKRIATTRKYVPGSHDGKSSKRLMTMGRKPVISTGVREISKKPVYYNKTGMETGKPVKKVPQKPALKKPVPTVPKDVECTPTVMPASKLEVKKSPDPPVEPFLEGHYELSPLLSKMLEAELQDIMIKIWQLLPDDPKDEADKVVVERFRNNAGDHLMNTLGLNVTKRLLNVHNSLYVKMQFSGTPLRAELMSFVRKYNITSFKSVGARARGGIFAAKVRNFQEFDNLCTAKNLKCGRVRITVTPVYQFMKCPSNLRTCYDGKHERDIAKIKRMSANRQKESQENAKTVEKDGNVQKDANKQTVTKVTPTKSNETSIVAEKISPTKTSAPAKDVRKVEVVTAVSEKQSPADKAVTSKQNLAATQNSAPKSTTNTTNSQNSALKVTGNSTQSQNSAPKVTTTPTQSQNSTPKVTANQAQNSAPKVTTNPTKPQNSDPKTTTKLTATPSQSTATKAVPPKPAQNENTAAKVTPTKPAGANNKNSSAEVKPQLPNHNTVQKVTQANQPVKVAPNKAIQPKAKSKQVSPVKKPENDFDELDDHDILALISGGIVLDECSGSEED